MMPQVLLSHCDFDDYLIVWAHEQTVLECSNAQALPPWWVWEITWRKERSVLKVLK